MLAVIGYENGLFCKNGYKLFRQKTRHLTFPPIKKFCYFFGSHYDILADHGLEIKSNKSVD